MYRDSNKFQALDAVAVPIQVVLSVLFADADDLALMALTLSRRQCKSELAAAADSGHFEPDSGHFEPGSGHLEPDRGRLEPNSGHFKPA